MTESNVLTQEENLRENRAVEAGTYEEKVLVRVENLRKYFPINLIQLCCRLQHGMNVVQKTSTDIMVDRFSCCPCKQFFPVFLYQGTYKFTVYS